MLTNRRKDAWIAAVLVAPFLAIYLLVFVWPTVQMFGISFTDAPLTIRCCIASVTGTIS